MRRWVLAATLSSSLLPSTASAYVRSTVDTDRTIPLFWDDRTLAFRLSLDSAPEDLSRGPTEQALVASLATWSFAGGCTNMNLRYGGVAGGSSTNLDGGGPDFENRMVFRTFEWPTERGAEAVALTTSIYRRSTGEMVDADIDINAFDHRWSVGDPVALERYDIQNTMVHELGHAIGFAHSPDPVATMYSRTNPEETNKRDLATDDLAAICDVYCPDCDPRPPGGCSASTTPRRSPLALGLFALVALAVGRRQRTRATSC